MATEINLRAYLNELENMLEHASPTEVVSHCRYILQHFPQNVAARRLLAQALLQQGQSDGLPEHYESAAEVFTEVLTAYPNDYVSHLGLSEIRSYQNELDAAIWHMERALEQLPGNRYLQDALRKLLAARDAEDRVPQKIQLTRAALARQYANGGMYDQALVEVRRALEQTPNRTDLMVLLAETLWDGGHQVEAGEEAVHILKLLPDSVAANRIMARLWLDYERPTDAQAFLDRLEALDPYIASAVLHPGGEEALDHVMVERLDYGAAAQAELLSTAPDWVQELGNLEREIDTERIFTELAELEESSAPPIAAGAEPGVADAGLDLDLPDWFTGDEPEWAGALDQAGERLPSPADPQIPPETLPDIPDWFVALGGTGEPLEINPLAEPLHEAPARGQGEPVEAGWLAEDAEQPEPPATQDEEFDWWSTGAAAVPASPEQKAPADLSDLLSDLAEDYGQSEDTTPEPDAGDWVRSLGIVPESSEDEALAESFAFEQEPPVSFGDTADEFWAAIERAGAASPEEADLAEGAGGPAATDEEFEDISATPSLDEERADDAEPEVEPQPADLQDWVADAGEPSVADSDAELGELVAAEARAQAGLPETDEAAAADSAEAADAETVTEAAPPPETVTAFSSDDAEELLGQADEEPSQPEEPAEEAAEWPETAAEAAAVPEEPGHLPEWLSAAALLSEPTADDWLSQFEMPGETEAEGVRAEGETWPAEEATLEEASEAPAENDVSSFVDALSATDQPEVELPDWLQLPTQDAVESPDVEQAEALEEPAEPEPVRAADQETDVWLRSFAPVAEDGADEEEATEGLAQSETEIDVLMPVEREPAAEDDDLNFPEDLFVSVAPDAMAPDETEAQEWAVAPEAEPSGSDEEAPAWLAGLASVANEVAERAARDADTDEPYDPFEGGSADNVPRYASARDTGILQPDEQPDWMGAFTSELHALDDWSDEDFGDDSERREAAQAEEAGAATEQPPEDVGEPDDAALDLDVSGDEMPAWLDAIASAADQEIDAELFGVGGTPEPSSEVQGGVAEEFELEVQVQESAASGLDDHALDLLEDVAADLEVEGTVRDEIDLLSALEADLAEEAAAAEETPEPDSAALDLSGVGQDELDALSALEADLAALERDVTSAPAEAETARLAGAEELDALSALEAELAGWEASGQEVALTPLDEGDLARAEGDALSKLEAELAALTESEPEPMDALAEEFAGVGEAPETEVPADFEEGYGLRDAEMPSDEELLATDISASAREEIEAEKRTPGHAAPDADLAAAAALAGAIDDEPASEFEVAGGRDLADTRAAVPPVWAHAPEAGEEPVPDDFSFGELLPLWLRRPLEMDSSALRGGDEPRTSEKPQWLREVPDEGQDE